MRARSQSSTWAAVLQGPQHRAEPWMHLRILPSLKSTDCYGTELQCTSVWFLSQLNCANLSKWLFLSRPYSKKSSCFASKTLMPSVILWIYGIPEEKNFRERTSYFLLTSQTKNSEYLPFSPLIATPHLPVGWGIGLKTKPRLCPASPCASALYDHGQHFQPWNPID